MIGERIVEVIRESHAAVLRTHGLELAPGLIEELARNAATIIAAELEAETEEQGGAQ